MRISDWSSDVCSSDLQIDEAVERIASQQKRYEAAPEGHEAKDGDQVVMDFVGKVDGEAFEGGTGEGMAVVIGSGNLIPGFEDQRVRSEEHTSELQSLMRISYAVLCLNKKQNISNQEH